MSIPPTHSNETIVAISTPLGRGGIGIVRLSGPEAKPIAEDLLRSRQPLEHARARFAEVFDIEHDPGRQSPIDQAVVTLFASPHSYTGENVVEIATHGSPVILETVLRSAIGRGARLAHPGEFTQRAFFCGRIDLTQAEAVRDLIDAQTLYQARVASQQMGGALSRRVRPVKQSLVDLVALLEAGIDFAEDDIDVVPDREIRERMLVVDSGLRAIAKSFTLGRIVHSGMTLAIVGRPNVGKSSLFNRLVERDRAIVTAMPGTTRDLVTERLSIGGIPLELIDTAGLRHASEEAESIGIQKSREALAAADIVLVVVDASQPLTQEERDLIEPLVQRKAILVRNKSDLLDLEPPEPQVPDALPSVDTSALTGVGIAELREHILSLIKLPGEGAEGGMLTNLRQHQEVSSAIEALAGAAASLEARVPHEMLLLDFYNALRALDALTGETTADDILNKIFSTFCIGK